MKPADIDRVFGHGRLRMVTGDHVEVYREEAQPGERRRYTKRFLATQAGDFRHWTEREWRILARLVGHGIGPVPDVVQFDRGAKGRPAIVQTYDAGITVDHWATLLPVQRDGRMLRHVFEDCAHWWALARQCLIALDAIHELHVVHLDLKADNVCIPAWPPNFDPRAPGQALYPRFEQLSLIDFAFSLVWGESLTNALPIARQSEYHYQSPRLLQALEAGRQGDLGPTRQLDWRCDLFSLAAMLRRYLPDPDTSLTGTWMPQRYAQARALVRKLLEAHDAERPAVRPHAELIALASRPLEDGDLKASLQLGWSLVHSNDRVERHSPTPITRIARPLAPHAATPVARVEAPRGQRLRRALWLSGVAAVAALTAAPLRDVWLAAVEEQQVAAAPATMLSEAPAPAALPASQAASAVVDAPAASAPVAAKAASAPVVAPAVAAKAASAPAVAPAASAAVVAQAASAPVVAPAASAPVIAEAASAPVMAEAASTPAAAAAASASAAVVEVAPTPAPPRAAAPASSRSTPAATKRVRAPEPPSAKPAPRERWLAQHPASKPARAPAVAARPAAPPKRATTPAPAPAAAATEVARAPAPLPAPAPAPSSPPPAPAPAPAPNDAPPPSPPIDLMARANELMSGEIPRIAQRAERLVLRVLFVAGQSEDADDEIRRTASAIRLAPEEPLAVVSAQDARAMNQSARDIYARRGDAHTALGLLTRAFAANPLDTEVVGNLASLRLRQQPWQAESARQLVLHALTTPHARHPYGRIEDWTTFAIASAMTGRDRDARNAWFVTLALASEPERQCRVAVNAYAKHGERLRSSVEAMLYRVHASGRSERSPFCEWPPHWSGNGRR